MNKKIITILALIAGFVFVVLAIIYFVNPASSLPTFIPGYDPNLSRHHFTHGALCLFLGFGAFAYVWFNSGKKLTKENDRQDTSESDAVKSEGK